MQYNLMGFTQDAGFRVFAFECIADDRSKTPHTIRVDLSLSQKHGIRIQELPLLCRWFLERGVPAEQAGGVITFTEAEMLLHERSCQEARAAALLKKKAPRRPMPSNVDSGNGWRGSVESKVAPAQLPRPFGSS